MGPNLFKGLCLRYWSSSSGDKYTDAMIIHITQLRVGLSTSERFAGPTWCVYLQARDLLVDAQYDTALELGGKVRQIKYQNLDGVHRFSGPSYGSKATRLPVRVCQVS